MANIKISELTELTDIATDDVLPIVDVSADETKKIKFKNVLNVELIAVTDTAPSECSTGDKYFNTTTNLIYTATATDTWGTTGESPRSGILYIVYSNQASYSWDGTNMVSIGGSGTSQITNSYSTSTSLGYSANYINNLNTYSTTEQRVGTWIDGKPLYRKVLTDSSTTSGDHNISISNISFDFIQLYTFCIKSGNYVLNVFGDNSSDRTRSFVNIDTKNVVWNTGSAWSTASYIGIIIYTKTTV